MNISTARTVVPLEHRKVAARVVLTALLWCSVISVGFSLAETGALDPARLRTDLYYLLDTSWQQCLPYFQEHHFLAGHDVAFTYGPLGFLMVRIFDAGLYATVVLWDLLSKLVVAWLAVRLCFLAGRGRVAALLAGALVLGANLFPLGADAWTYVAYTILLLSVAFDRPPPPLRMAVLLFVAAVGPLVKLTLLPLSLFVVCVVTLASGGSGRRLSRLWPVTAFMLFETALWFGLGQKASNLPGHMSAALQISGGYNDTMFYAGPHSGVLVFTLAGSLIACLCALTLLVVRYARRRDMAGAFALMSLAALCLLAMKHGFLRPDHASLYYLTVLFLAALVAVACAVNREIDRLAGGALAVAGLLAIVGLGKLAFPIRDVRAFPVVGNVSLLWRLGTQFSDLKVRQAAVHETPYLPAVKAVVGSASVDQFTNYSGVVITDGLNYRPRPVFQGYSAYTERLQDMNADFYAGLSAPDYVLYRPAAIDGRYPSTEDARALLVLLDRYRPVLREKGYLLLARAGTAGSTRLAAARMAAKTDASGSRTERFGEWIDCPTTTGTGGVWVSLDVRESIAGKAIAALWKHGEVYLDVRGADGAEKRYRLIPRMAASGFLLSPTLSTTGDLAGLMGVPGAPPPKTVRVFRVVAEGRDARLYRDTFTVRMTVLPAAVP